MLLKY